MKLIKIFPLFMLIMFFQSCDLYNFMRKENARKDESILTSNFISKIPFIYEQGAIVISLKINGKKFNFILDSGAPTIIGEDVLTEVEYKNLGHTLYKDSQGTSKKLKNIQIKELSIEDINFSNVIAAVSDFSEISESYPCFDTQISGIIGYNIIKKAVWHFNFNENLIILSNENTKKSEKSDIVFNFDSYYPSRPIVNLNLGDSMIGKVLFDLGYNGSMILPYRFSEKIAKKYNSNILFGKSSSAFGRRIDTLLIAKCNVDKINSQKIENSFDILFTKKQSKPLIGTRFIENYYTILNGPNQTLTLSNYSLLRNNSNRIFGMTFFIYDSELRVSSIKKNSIGYKRGIRIDDKITEINGISFNEFANNKYCDLLLTKIYETNLLNISIEKNQGINNYIFTKQKQQLD